MRRYGNFLILFGLSLALVGSLYGLYDLVRSTNPFNKPLPTLAAPLPQATEDAGFLPLVAPPPPTATPTPPPTPTSTLFRVLPYQETPTPLPSPTPTPTPIPVKPVFLLIPAINLEAPVVEAHYDTIILAGKTYRQWLAPNFRAAGWHTDSAPLGQPGNTVLNGHHNIAGEVFRDLYQLKIGDQIFVKGDNGQIFIYQVSDVNILPEKGQPLDVRLENAKWILPTEDERLTLISCWPYETNTHRVIVVAKPLHP